MNLCKRNIALSCVGAGLICVPFGIAQAEMLVYEGFDYQRVQWRSDFEKSEAAEQTGGIAGLDGGLGFVEAWRTDSSWDNGIAVASDYPVPHYDSDARTTPLTYIDSNGNQLEQSNGALRTGFANYTRSHRNLASTIDQGEIWVGFIAQAAATRGSRYSFISLGNADAGSDDADGCLRLGMDSSSSSKWNIQQVGSTSSEGTINSGDMVMYLAKIQLNDFDPFDVENSKDHIDVWFNPELDSVPTKEADISVDLDENLVINTVSVWSRYSTDFDELRIGTTFEDVTPYTVPEPASLGLICGGLLAFAVRRR